MGHPFRPIAHRVAAHAHQLVQGRGGVRLVNDDPQLIGPVRTEGFVQPLEGPRSVQHPAWGTPCRGDLDHRNFALIQNVRVQLVRVSFDVRDREIGRGAILAHGHSSQAKRGHEQKAIQELFHEVDGWGFPQIYESRTGYQSTRRHTHLNNPLQGRRMALWPTW